MASHVVLSRVLLLLLFVYLLPLGGHSHPPFSSSQASGQSGIQDQVLEPQVMQMAQEQFPAGKAVPEDPMRFLGIPFGQPRPKTQSSKCFKERLDQIGISRSLGCKGSQKQKTGPTKLPPLSREN